MYQNSGEFTYAPVSRKVKEVNRGKRVIERNYSCTTNVSGYQSSHN